MLSIADFIILALYALITLVLGFMFYKKGSKNTEEFFGGGKVLPWWLGGLSLVATTFAADTPLAVTELVRKNGISGNWLWWNMLMGGMLTTFFFARYWRRSEALTDLELISLRYSGKEASYLRGIKAIYFGLLLNTIIIGWVNVAMATILEVFFDLTHFEALLYVSLGMLITVIYTSVSGLLGVVYTDAVQFIIAMGGCIILAFLVISLPEISGLQGLSQKLSSGGYLDFFPKISEDKLSTSLSLSGWSFFAFVGVQWWASWYPGAEPGGGGYVAQRLLASKNEKHALASVLFFQILHFAFRPWPWILVALATIILYPNLSPEQFKNGYIMTMKDFLPSGLKGLLLVAFLAAYMSTIATHINWGLSYLINDFYRPFIAPQKTEKEYVRMARVFTAGILLLAILLTTQISRIEQAWTFIIECGAGAGLVLILRWYWWRVSAWSEIIALITPLFVFGIQKYLFIAGGSAPDSFFRFPNTYLITVLITTIVWIGSTFILPRTDEKILMNFYKKVQPSGFWGKFKSENSDIKIKTPLYILFICWVASTFMVFGLLFGTGKLLFMDFQSGFTYLGISLACVGLVYYLGKKFDVFS